jgi:hypothetical protein
MQACRYTHRKPRKIEQRHLKMLALQTGVMWPNQDYHSHQKMGERRNRFSLTVSRGQAQKHVSGCCVLGEAKAGLKGHPWVVTSPSLKLEEGGRVVASRAFQRG